MTTLNDFSVVDRSTDALAIYYNKILGSIFRNDFVNSMVMTTDIILTDGDTPIQRLNCNGANRIVKVPVGANGNHPLLLVNTTSSGSWTLTVESNDGVDTLKILEPGANSYFLPNGDGKYIVIGAGVSDHGALTGLSDDDHSQYLLATGLRDWDEQGSDPSTPSANKWKLYFKSGGLYYIDDAGVVIGPLDVRNYLAKSGLTEWDEQGSDPSTPSANKWKLYFKSGGLYLVDDAGVVTGPLGSGGAGGTYPCFARASVVNGTANPTTDYTAQTSVYVFPFGGGDTYQQWNGSIFAPKTFTVQTLSLNAAHLSGSLYDQYLWDDGGTQRVVTGPAWTSSTSRGTGAGTAETEVVNGVEVNKVSMTVRNGATTYTMPARYGTLVGTICPSANGQVEWSKTNRGVWNKYNRLPAILRRCPAYNNNGADNSFSVTTSIAEANGSNNGRVAYVIGEPSKVAAMISAYCAPAGSNVIIVAAGFDTVSTPTAEIRNPSGVWGTYTGKESKLVDIGSHYVAMLARTNTSTGSIYADWGASRVGSVDQEVSVIEVDLEM